jgi:L-2-hydroxyglutarate oxidase LhgO
VYTVQNPKLPFAAVHGDPDLNDLSITRFGPTAMVLPIFERGKYKTFVDFLNVSANLNVAMAFGRVMLDKDTRAFAFENLQYKLPGGDTAFTDTARKIVPELERLRPLKGVGGIRPQLCRDGRVFMGEAKVSTSDAIFDITPSPGASVCLKNALDDAQHICNALGATFDLQRFHHDFRA